MRLTCVVIHRKDHLRTNDPKEKRKLQRYIRIRHDISITNNLKHLLLDLAPAITVKIVIPPPFAGAIVPAPENPQTSWYQIYVRSVQCAFAIARTLPGPASPRAGDEQHQDETGPTKRSWPRVQILSLVPTCGMDR